MSLIQREWTAREADNWTKEDIYVIILSPLVYFLLTLGTAMSCLLMPIGFITVGIGLVLMFLMIFIINPKLDVISEDYEKRQAQYLIDLEKQIKWEES